MRHNVLGHFRVCVCENPIGMRISVFSFLAPLNEFYSAELRIKAFYLAPAVIGHSSVRKGDTGRTALIEIAWRIRCLLAVNAIKRAPRAM